MSLTWYILFFAIAGLIIAGTVLAFVSHRVHEKGRHRRSH